MNAVARSTGSWAAEVSSISGSAVASAPNPQEIIVDCPYCNHAWKADLRWISGPCPNCGRMVYRYMDPQHD